MRGEAGDISHITFFRSAILEGDGYARAFRPVLAFAHFLRFIADHGNLAGKSSGLFVRFLPAQRLGVHEIEAAIEHDDRREIGDIERGHVRAFESGRFTRHGDHDLFHLIGSDGFAQIEQRAHGGLRGAAHRIAFHRCEREFVPFMQTIDQRCMVLAFALKCAPAEPCVFIVEAFGHAGKA